MSFKVTFLAMSFVCLTMASISQATVNLSAGVSIDSNTIIRTVDASHGLVCFTVTSFDNSSSSCVKRMVRSAPSLHLIVGKMSGNQIKIINDDEVNVNCVVSSGFKHSSISCQ